MMLDRPRTSDKAIIHGASQNESTMNPLRVISRNHKKNEVNRVFYNDDAAIMVFRRSVQSMKLRIPLSVYIYEPV
jgi:hypothetical protein